jgi:hypothetical protein
MSEEKDPNSGETSLRRAPTEASNAPVLIALTQEQTRTVLRTTGQRQDFTIRRALSGMLSGDEISAESLACPPPSSTLVSHTLFRGLLVLAYFVAIEGSASLEEVSGRIGLPKATTLRYLRALVAHGLLSQDSRTREYRLVR